MAATWICERCGRANAGDLCPGCAEPRPIRVRSAYGSEKNREILDGVSEPRREPLSPLPFFVLAVLAVIGIASWEQSKLLLLFTVGAFVLLLILNVSIGRPLAMALRMCLRRKRG